MRVVEMNTYESGRGVVNHVKLEDMDFPECSQLSIFLRSTREPRVGSRSLKMNLGRGKLIVAVSSRYCVTNSSFKL